MKNFRLYAIWTCLQVISLFRGHNCVKFECTETPSSISTNNICTLENSNISEITRFQLILTSPHHYTAVLIGSVHDLWFKSCRVLYIPTGIFTQLYNVRSLHMDGCGLLELSPSVFNPANNLLVINLANNNITTLPESSFIGARNLADINLAHNQIGHINANVFKSLSKVTRINLSSNQIVSIPDNLFAHLIAIADLDLSNNLISVFGPWFNNTNQITIERLNLNDNRIANISLNSNVVINELTANYNELIVIDLEWSGVTVLRADHNKLENNGLLIDECNPIELSLKNNSLLDFDFVRNMSNLKYLDLSYNMDANQSLTSDSFEINNHRLEAVTNSQFHFNLFSNLHRLVLLDISYNHLKSIDFFMCSALPNLTRLYINGNNLTFIPVSDFKFVFPNLKTIDLSENNWLCYDLRDILRKLHQIKVKTMFEPKQVTSNETMFFFCGIRCYHDSKVWSSDQTMEQHSSEADKSKHNDRFTFEWMEFIKKFDADRYRTTLALNELSEQVQTLESQFDTKINQTIDETLRSLAEHDDGSLDAVTSGLADDVKLIKILMGMFLMFGIGFVGLKWYWVYVKRPYNWKARFHPSSNTMTTNVEENNQ